MLANNISIKNSPGITKKIFAAHNCDYFVLNHELFVPDTKRGFKDANFIKTLVAIGAFGKLQILSSYARATELQ